MFPADPQLAEVPILQIIPSAGLTPTGSERVQGFPEHMQLRERQRLPRLKPKTPKKERN